MTLAIGDLHLDKFNAIIPDAEDRVLTTLAAQYTMAREQGHGDVVLLGDVFDNAYPEQTSVSKVIRFLHSQKAVKTHVIMGNHDHDDTDHHSLEWMRTLFRLRFLNGMVYTKPKVVELDDEERYWFCPHPYAEDQPKGTRYAFGHFGYAGARGDNGYVIRSGNSPRGRWVLGDYHTKQRGKNWMYPGSLCQCNFHESSEKFVVDVGEKLRAIQVSPALRLGRAKIESEADLKALDPAVFWSVNIVRGAKLEPTWALQYPQVVRHHTDKAANRRQQVLMKQVASEDPLEGLAEWLANEGLNDAEVTLALRKLGRK